MNINNQDKESRLEEFTKNPKKALWTLSLPMMLGMSVQAMYMLADTAFVGRMIVDNKNTDFIENSGALASLGYVFPFLFIIMGIAFGLGSGATTIIAQFIGAKDKNNADNAAEHTILLGIIIGIIISSIGFYYGDKLLGMQGADENTIKMALDYFYIMAGGSIFVVLSVFFRSILSGEGEMKFPMIIMGLGTVLNIILDPFLIYHYQIKGAAIATVISQALVTFAFIYFLLFRHRSYVTFNLMNFKFNFDILRNIFCVGVPASLSMVIMSMGVMLFNTILGSSQTVPAYKAVAAYQTAGRIEHFFFLPIISIATSLVTLAGMFYGAKRIDLIRKMIKYGISRSVIISLSFSLFFFFFSDKIIPLFTDDPQIIELTIFYFTIMVFAYPFITIGMTSSRIMQGMGYAYPMLILTLLRVVILSASLAWYFVIILEKPVHWAWYGTLISCIITALVSITWLWKIIQQSVKSTLAMD